MWRHHAAELLTVLSSGVEPGLCFMSWLPRESVRRPQCLSLGCMLSLLAVGQFALEVRVTRSVPISIPRTAAFPDEVIFTCSLLSPLKLFSHPAGKSGGPKVEVGSKRGSASLMAKLQRSHIREALPDAVGEVRCHLLGTWFFPLHSEGGIITRLHQGRVKVCLLTAFCC